MLGSRKKKAKCLMRTFTCRSTFLYGPTASVCQDLSCRRFGPMSSIPIRSGAQIKEVVSWLLVWVSAGFSIYNYNWVILLCVSQCGWLDRTLMGKQLLPYIFWEITWEQTTWFFHGQEQAWANPQHDPSLNALLEQLLLKCWLRACLNSSSLLCKKSLAIFPSLAGMSLTKLSLAGNN